MNNILQDLLTLQALDFGETKEKNAKARADELRGKIPQPFIGHYERLRVRAKKGVAVVRNQVCTGCHMHVPIGQITVLMRGEDIQLCESCGRYLYLPAPAETEPVVQVESPKPKKKAPAKPRKRRAMVAVL
jgi:predicted  nucleic acid-binding Zn-ribbon protein